MKHLKPYNLFEAADGRLQLSKPRLIALVRLIAQTEISEINNASGKLEVVYHAPQVDVSKLFPHMHTASFEYRSTITNIWAEVEIRAWDPYEVDNRKVYILKTNKFKRRDKEYQAVVHIFMKHMIDSGRPINY